MKKSIFIIAATALVISCASNDVKKDIEESLVPIGFTKTYIEKNTKAINKGAYTSLNFEKEGNTFGVWSFKTTESQNNAQVHVNQKVEYKSGLTGPSNPKQNYEYDDTKDWTYTPLKYWDNTASEYKFFAYAPHDGDFTGTAALSGSSPTAFSISGFEQAHTQPNMIDLMTDLTSKQSVTPSTSKKIGQNDVEFTFGHILSNINIKMAVSPALKADKDNNPVTVVSLTLGAIKMDGSYAYDTPNTKYAWTLASTPSTQTFPATKAKKFNDDGDDGTTAEIDVVFASNELKSQADGFTAVPEMTDLLFVPQAVDAAYAISLEYYIGLEKFERTILLSAFQNNSSQTLATWSPGYQYNYNIVIGPDPILFDIETVSDWSDGGTYTYIVQ